MALQLSRAALREINRILADLKRVSPKGAASVAARLDAVLTTISEFPGSGRATERAGVRCINTQHQPYLIFYRVDVQTGVVDVIAVRHGGRNPASMPAHRR